MSHIFDDQVVIPSLKEQMGFDFLTELVAPSAPGVFFSAPTVDLDMYDHIVLCMSGGKDSIASLLALFDLGVDRSKIELWHHDVDGREGSSLMDWTFMADYNRKLASTFSLPIYFSWLEGGFEGEMNKENGFGRPHHVETPHSCDRRNGRKARHVDAWRPVLDWEEDQVWDALRRHNVIAPVPYRLGWGRSSCMKCIFNSGEIWATLQTHFPGSLDQIDGYEQKFNTTIRREKIRIVDLAKKSRPMQIDDKEALVQATQKDYTLPILSVGAQWTMPVGAFSHAGCGPT